MLKSHLYEATSIRATSERLDVIRTNGLSCHVMDLLCQMYKCFSLNQVMLKLMVVKNQIWCYFTSANFSIIIRRQGLLAGNGKSGPGIFLHYESHDPNIECKHILCLHWSVGEGGIYMLVVFECGWLFLLKGPGNTLNNWSQGSDWGLAHDDM